MFSKTGKFVFVFTFFSFLVMGDQEAKLVDMFPDLDASLIIDTWRGAEDEAGAVELLTSLSHQTSELPTPVPPSSEDIEELSKMFPSVEETIIRQRLTLSGNVESAANEFLTHGTPCGSKSSK